MSGISVETLDGEIRVRGGQSADTVEVAIRDDDAGTACAEMTVEHGRRLMRVLGEYLARAEKSQVF